MASGLTIKDRPAVLGGGGQRQAGRIELVAVVPDADLELDCIINILQHGGRVEGGEEGILAPSEVLLGTERAARESQGGGRETPEWGGVTCLAGPGHSWWPVNPAWTDGWRMVQLSNSAQIWLLTERTHSRPVCLATFL